MNALRTSRARGRRGARALGFAALFACAAPAAGQEGATRIAAGGVGNAKAPELPRATVDVRAPAPVPGARTLRPASGSELQLALNEARPGDVIALRGGATYVGNFVLRRRPSPASTAARWVTVRTEGVVIEAGTRASPAAASAFARLVTPNADPVVSAEQGAHHFRFEAVEMTTRPDAAPIVALVRLGNGGPEQRTPAQVPHHLVLAHVYAHGQPRVDLRRCIDLNASWSAVVDSYVAECHSKATDSQAVWAGNAPGPFTIENNTLEGAGENVMFGGSDAASAELLPSDITIRGNHVVKPMSWKGHWLVKNLLEMKVGRRVLVEGNVFENSWPSGQIGFAVLLWSVNQDGRAPFSETSDVTFRYNVVRNAANGFQLATAQRGQRAVPMHRVLIHDNVVVAIGTNRALGYGGGRVFQIQGNIADLAIAHNTSVGVDGPWVYFVSPPNTRIDRLAIVDNVVNHARPAVRSDAGLGLDALRLYAGEGTVMRNNVLGGWEGPRVPGNFYLDGGVPLFSLVGVANGDFRLSADSPFRRAATDDRDVGADITAVDSATRDAVPPAAR